MEPVAVASFDPSSPGPVAEPAIKDPPWILEKENKKHNEREGERRLTTS